MRNRKLGKRSQLDTAGPCAHQAVLSNGEKNECHDEHQFNSKCLNQSHIYRKLDENRT